MTNVDKVLKHLKRYGGITNKQAIASHDNYRLSNSILLLRRRGILIEMDLIKNKKTGKVHGKYYLSFK